MKKLMIAAAIVCAAAISQAAAISWGSDPITLSDGKTQAVKNNVSAYLFMLPDEAAYNKLAASATSGKALSDAVWAAYGAGITAEPPTYNATKDSTAKGVANLSDGKDTYAAGNYYAAILYTDNTNPGYYMGNVAIATVEGTFDAEVVGLSKFIGGGASGTATAWSTAAVPEPTSGLLLLLGVAGLALRRRRA